MEEGTPPRKYYRLTDFGSLYLKTLEKDWLILVENISNLREE